MSSINFNKKTFGFGYINGYSRFYQFSERWLFSTNHKYIGIFIFLIYLFQESFINFSSYQLALFPIAFWNNRIYIKNPFLLSYFIIELTMFAMIFFDDGSETEKIISIGIFFLFTCIIMYTIFYEKLEIEKKISSFMAFFVIMLITVFYVTGFYSILKGFQNPIYISDLSLISQYKYVFFCLISLLFLLCYTFCYSLYSMLTYPYLKEEIYKILYIWNDRFFGPMFTFIIEKLENRQNRYKYICIHFFFFFFLRFFLTILFINFVFFGGDLRNILYLLPLSFLLWLLSFLDYYFEKFYNGSSNYIKSLVEVKVINNKLNMDANIIKANQNDFSFSLTPIAYSEGLTNLKILADLWFQYCDLDIFFQKYGQYKKFAGLFILLSQCFCWFTISFLILSNFEGLYNLAVQEGFFLRVSNAMTKAVIPLRHPIQAYGVKKQFWHKFEKDLEGSFKGGHPILADPNVINPDNPSEILYGGQATKGNGSPQNSSFPLHPNQTLNGDNNPQNYVPPVRSNTYILKSALTSPIPNSKEYMESPGVKAAHAKNLPQEENT